MALHAVLRIRKEDSVRDHYIIKVNGRQHQVFRTSPLYGDMGWGVVKVNGKTYTVYRTKKEDGDIGYGVVNIQYKSPKKQGKNDTKKRPDDLVEIIRVWSGLPDNIKSKIEALVKTHGKEIELTDTESNDGRLMTAIRQRRRF